MPKNIELIKEIGAERMITLYKIESGYKYPYIVDQEDRNIIIYREGRSMYRTMVRVEGCVFKRY